MIKLTETERLILKTQAILCSNIAVVVSGKKSNAGVDELIRQSQFVRAVLLEDKNNSRE